jgi:hypothetical protein
VRAIVSHYDSQPTQQAIAEADAAMVNSRMTLVRVPNELVAKVEALIASHDGGGAGPSRPAKKKAKSRLRRSA